MTDQVHQRAPRTPLLTGERIRSAIWQIALLAGVVWLAWSAIENATRNMQARGIPTNFDFWHRTAGFDINASLIPFSAANNTYGDAFYVGLLNTLLVGACGVVLATILGFLIGIARLSSNWMVGRLAGGYVEIVRNTPLLLQLLFWYNAVLTPLPGPRQSLELPGGVTDAADSGPLEAAERELREETGFAAREFRLVVSLSPNSATHTNRIHTVLALGAYADAAR